MNGFRLLAVLIPLFTSGGGRGVAAAAPPTEFVPDFFVSPTGNAANPGTEALPWTLAYAFSGASGVLQPGHQVGIRGGTYTGDFDVSVSGTAENQITFRNHNNEEWIIDSTDTAVVSPIISGNYLTMWGFVCRYTGSSVRSTLESGSTPTDIGNRWRKAFRNQGHHNKFINFVNHDTGDTITDQNVLTAYASEWHGGLCYNGGWDAPDRGHGHGCYFQNKDIAGKLIDDCVFYGSFASGIKLAGSGAAWARYITIRGCVSLDAASVATPGQQWLIHNEGGGDAPGGTGVGGTTIEDCSFFFTNNAAEEFMRLNAGGDPTSTLGWIYRRNISVGQPAFNESSSHVITDNKFAFGDSTPGQIRVPAIRLDTPEGYVFADYILTGNAYASLTANFPWSVNLLAGAGGQNYNSLAAWQAATGWDADSSHTAANKFAGSDIIYRPNDYETGRGWIYCWNWDDASSLNLDLSQVGLVNGDNYEIYHVYNVDRPYPPTANACNTGTYTTGTVAVTQTGYTAPVPYGWTGATPPTSAPRFNVFLVRKV